MFPGETILSGCPHDGFPLRVLHTPAGYYLGTLTEYGTPNTRESEYLPSEEEAQTLIAEWFFASRADGVPTVAHTWERLRVAYERGELTLNQKQMQALARIAGNLGREGRP